MTYYSITLIKIENYGNSDFFPPIWTLVVCVLQIIIVLSYSETKNLHQRQHVWLSNLDYLVLPGCSSLTSGVWPQRAVLVLLLQVGKSNLALYYQLYLSATISLSARQPIISKFPIIRPIIYCMSVHPQQKQLSLRMSTPPPHPPPAHSTQAPPCGVFPVDENVSDMDNLLLCPELILRILSGIHMWKRLKTCKYCHCSSGCALKRPENLSFEHCVSCV